MNAGIFNNSLSNSAELGNNMEESLSKGLLNYPYCATLHFMRAKLAKKLAPNEYESLRGTAAAYAVSREALFCFLNPPITLNQVADLAVLEEEKPYIFTETSVDENQLVTESNVAEDNLIKDDEAIDFLNAESEVEDLLEPLTIQPETVSPQDYFEVSDQLPTEFQNVKPAGTYRDAEALVHDEEIKVSNEASEDEQDDYSTPPEFHRWKNSLETPVNLILQKDTSITETVKSEELESENTVIPHKKETLQVFEPLPTILEGENKIALSIDDKLPHTFTFWLRRIRGVQDTVNYATDHVDTTVPIKRVVTTDIGKEFLENALHVSNLNELEQTVVIEFDLRKKEDQIIERFIREEPMIRAVQLNEISFEDKSEKSTNDEMAIVSETMAKIYADQHLYEKAIVVYEKLCLKYPEKNTYFAAQIEKLKHNS
ncbi:hypothetical protein [Solitalea lacus]|uniref:hypothetical protein n=1 Tax=Solitalea lacus TaxID=2911172 RepID=UPI001EDA861B|nr:hypothetical protein [Solitalea lacus]UKJ08046.1 hypothetical protein L2B55_02490 [Solitalea lacus]